MMGLAIALGLMLAAAAGLVLLGLPRRIWAFAASALLIGGAGYALQGRPGQPAAPAIADEAKYPTEPSIVDLREQLFGRFNREAAYFTIADALEGAGDTAGACKIMVNGVRHGPRDAALWTWLGTTIATRDGAVSPAARLAFHRALQLVPTHPGPPFFTGLAYARAGQLDEARRYWAEALARAPAEAPYHEPIAKRLRLLDMLIDFRRRAQAAQQAQ